MKSLLAKLHRETFVLDLAADLSEPPAVAGYPVRLTDAHTLEVEVEKGQGLTGVFRALAEQGVEVDSMRNKSNRLEELFMGLVENRTRGLEADTGRAA